MSDSVVVAIIAATASVVGAIFAYLAASRSKTSNGHRQGELVEQMAERLARVEVWTVEHLRDHAHASRNER
jgi:hypothetical protein